MEQQVENIDKKEFYAIITLYSYMHISKYRYIRQSKVPIMGRLLRYIIIDTKQFLYRER